VWLWMSAVPLSLLMEKEILIRAALENFMKTVKLSERGLFICCCFYHGSPEQ
ncbi:hypothetical protein KI387_007420, partial [Taxus chinensis]